MVEGKSDGEHGRSRSWRAPALVAVGLAVGLTAGLAGGVAIAPDDNSAATAVETRVSGVSVERSSTSTFTSTSTTVAGHVHNESTTSTDGVDRPDITTFNGADRLALARQLIEARDVALRYPTLGLAAAAGFEPTTPFTPGLGAHMGRDDYTQAPGQPLDLTKPQSYLYDGTGPDARVVGLMYVQLGGGTAPDGFVGPLDTWSEAAGQCLKADEFDPLFPASDPVTEAVCTSAGGRFIDISAWTQHVWVVPGWEAPGGVFAGSNTDIVCAAGVTEVDPVTGCASPVA